MLFSAAVVTGHAYPDNNLPDNQTGCMFPMDHELVGTVKASSDNVKIWCGDMRAGGGCRGISDTQTKTGDITVHKCAVPHAQGHRTAKIFT